MTAVTNAFSLTQEFQLLEGTVTSIVPDGAFVKLDVGVQGLLHISQVSHFHVGDGELGKYLAVGDRIKVMVLEKNKSLKQLALSTKCFEARRGDFLRSSRLVFDNAESVAGRLLDIEEQDLQLWRVVEGIVLYTKPMGAVVRLSKSQTGWLHISHISHLRVQDVALYVKQGDRLKVMVCAIDPTTNQIDLTIKMLETKHGDFRRDPELVFDNAESVARRFQNIKEQEIQRWSLVEGVVIHTTPTIALVRLANSQVGALHISQISHHRVQDVRALLKTGDRLKAMVHKLDPEQNRFSLSTRMLEAKHGDFLRDPQLVYNNAEKAADEMRMEYLSRNVLKTVLDGEAADEDEMEVMDEREIAATCKAFEDVEELQLMEGTVTDILRTGVVVKLDNGCVGSLHISQVSHHRVEHGGLGTYFALGERVKAVVLETEAEGRFGRIRLTLKCLEERRGDFLRSPRQVFDNAESVAGKLLDIEEQDIQPGGLVEGVVIDSETARAVVRLSKTQHGWLPRNNITDEHVPVVSDIIKHGDRVKAMVCFDPVKKGVDLTTKVLEANPGDFLRDPQLVFDNADAAAEKVRVEERESVKALKQKQKRKTSKTAR